jgi:hypothetical protein
VFDNRFVVLQEVIALNWSEVFWENRNRRPGSGRRGKRSIGSGKRTVDPSVWLVEVVEKLVDRRIGEVGVVCGQAGELDAA